LYAHVYFRKVIMMVTKILTMVKITVNFSYKVMDGFLIFADGGDNAGS